MEALNKDSLARWCLLEVVTGDVQLCNVAKKQEKSKDENNLQIQLSVIQAATC